MTSETAMYRTTRIVWYIFGAIEALLAIRFILRALGANTDAAFTQFVYATSHIFLAPFQFVFGTPFIGGAALEFSTLLAMAVYWLIAWGIVKLLLMNRPISRYEAHVQLQDQDVT
jgi:uncharacterized protein YggT (Ycf19 family)